MLGVGKVGMSMVGPGIVTGPGAPTVLIEGMPCSVLGDIIAPHGEPPHSTAVIVSNCSKTVFAMMKPISRDTSLGTCAHVLAKGAVTVKNIV